MVNGKPKQSVMLELSAVSDQLSARGKEARFSPVASRPSPLAPRPARRAFTLTELLVVLAILGIVATLAVPAVGPMFASNQTASAVSTIGSLLVTAQTTARAYGTPVGLRIERALKADSRGYMVERISNKPAFELGVKAAFELNDFLPLPLDHQQVRLVAFAPGRPGTPVSQAFEVPVGSFDPVALPKDIWVAPGESLTRSPSQLTESALRYRPYYPGDNFVGGVEYSRFEDFLVIFNAAGELVRHPADKCYFKDDQQTYAFHPTSNAKYAPFVRTVEDSSLSLIAYDRNKWNGINPADGFARRDFLQRTTPIYINRFTGAILEEKR